MPKKGYKVTEETKRKIKKNNARYWLGKKRPDTGLKVSIKLTGRKLSEEHVEHIRLSVIYRWQDPKFKRKVGQHISESLKGHLTSKETVEKMSVTKKRKFASGELVIWNKNKKCPQLAGKNCNWWQGGKSFEPYTTDWTDILKESIRKRDGYICQMEGCGIHQDELDRKLDIHHKDYNKKNLNPKNLIALCRKCHAKTNYNREYWINYFKEL